MAGGLPTILADENMALVREAFAPLGELRTVAGRSISRAMLADVDILLVRSVTRVDAELLSGSRCKFVGTATSGVDHVDTAWLQSRGVAFADAHGCNAEAVVDYVLAALAAVAQRNGTAWRERSLGIIGCGAVGSRLARRALALGLRLLVHDPGLDAAHPLAAWFAPLDRVLQQEIVSLHTPLTDTGPWPTFHMLDASRLQLLRPDAVLVNAARGAVIDTQALLARLGQAPGIKVILDAWEGEPSFDRGLLARVAIGTPHIAGYSRLGKLRGTLMLREALHRHLGLAAPGPLFEPEEFIMPLLQATGADGTGVLEASIRQAYDIEQDHAAMQRLLELSPPAAAAGFDLLRKQYRERAEFNQFTVAGSGLKDADRQSLIAAGFRTQRCA